MRRSTLAPFLLALGLVLVAGPARAFCLFNCNVAKTKYPIVLAHGTERVNDFETPLYRV